MPPRIACFPPHRFRHGDWSIPFSQPSRSGETLLLAPHQGAARYALSYNDRSSNRYGMSSVTHLLSAIERGDPQAAEQLLPLAYEELRKLAAARLAQEKPGQTLQATALV